MVAGRGIPLLKRSQQVYDRWGEWQALYRVISRVNELPRKRASDRLGLTGGETVLEVGCGPGVNFPLVRNGVGSGGEVVGVDISSGMIRRAIQRQCEQGWKNVEPVLGDATQMPAENSVFDAAFASLALSVIPEARNVVESVYDVLKPGGQFVVYDSVGRYQEGIARLLNPLHTRFVKHMFNHQLGQDIVQELRAVFNIVDVVETFKSGSEYIAVATKPADGIG